jgi:hypothetical protein
MVDVVAPTGLHARQPEGGDRRSRHEKQAGFLAGTAMPFLTEG